MMKTCRSEVATMRVMGKEAIIPARLACSVTVSGVLKYSQADSAARSQPMRPAKSAAILRQISRTRTTRMGRRARRMERRFMGGCTWCGMALVYATAWEMASGLAGRKHDPKRSGAGGHKAT